MVREMELPFGVVINRASIGDRRVERYCMLESIDILLKIPDDRKIAETYSRGELFVKAFPGYRVMFNKLYSLVTSEVFENVNTGNGKYLVV